MPPNWSDDLQTILDAFPFYIMLVDSDHTILLANQAVNEALNVSPQEILGGYCPEIVHGRCGPHPGCPLEDAVAQGCSVECDMFDDDHQRVLVSGIFETPFETAGGNRIYLHTTRDITEQRDAENRLARSYDIQAAISELLRIALEPITLDRVLKKVLDLIASIKWLRFAAKGAIFVSDERTDSLILEAQSGMESQAKALCAKVPFGTCHCGRAAMSREIQIVAGIDEAHDIHVPGAAPHGHYCVPIVQGDHVLGVLNLYIDEAHHPDPNEVSFLSAVANVLGGIIQRNRAEEQQRNHERIARTRERMARLGEIAAGVAHTVRNPLHGVLNCVDILESRVPDADPEVSEVLSLMREGIVRIDKVTRRLLSFTRDAAAQPMASSVDDLFADIERLMIGIATPRGVNLVFENRPTAEATMDADRVAEALLNIIGNAIDACTEGDSVTVSGHRDDDQTLIIEVRDTGEGIAAADLPRVLDPFFTTKPMGEGSGLGLAIARRVMDEHDGSIEIESELGQGTCVRLMIPQDID